MSQSPRNEEYRQETSSVVESAARFLETTLWNYRDSVYRFAFRLTRNRDDAEDIAAEVLIRAALGLPRFRRDSSLTTWLKRIALNVFLTECRRRRRFPLFSTLVTREAPEDAFAALLESILGGDPAPGPEEALLDAELSRIVRAAMTRLLPSHREVLILRYVKGLTQVETAQLMGLTGSSNGLSQRARDALKKEVVSQLGDDAVIESERRAQDAIPRIPQ